MFALIPRPGLRARGRRQHAHPSLHLPEQRSCWGLWASERKDTLANMGAKGQFRFHKRTFLRLNLARVGVTVSDTFGLSSMSLGFLALDTLVGLA